MAHSKDVPNWNQVMNGSAGGRPKSHAGPTGGKDTRASQRAAVSAGSASGGSKAPTLGSRASRHHRSTATTSPRVSAGRRQGRNGKDKGRKKKRSLGKRIGLWIVYTFLGVIIAGLAAFLILYATLKMPQPENVALAQSTTVYYADGQTEMGEFSDVNRTIIDPSTLPAYVPHAVVASEDQTFYTNSGVNFRGILRAMVNNVTGGERQGGSSITQQYVERYYEGETTSYLGKIKEMVLALKINRQQTKDEIIGNYLNTIYFGRGAYGIEEASKAYFGHSAKDLTVSEAALLAGIIPAPSAWDPAVDSDMAQVRWKRVINNMVAEGWLSASDAAKAQFPKTISPEDSSANSMTGTNGYLLQQIRTELKDSGQFSDEQLETGGLRIVSTIDKAKQEAAVSAAESMQYVAGWDPGHMHVALSSVDPTNGEIVAEYAGADYQKRQQNAVTQDIAQAGSTFKVFALLADARQGGSMSDVFNGNSPQTFPGLKAPVSNDGNYSWGPVNLLTATKYSVNTAFVALNQQIGADTTMQAAIDAGIPKDTAGLDGSLLNVLGVASPHNIDLTQAYATIANGGVHVEAHIVREVKNSTGATVYKAPNKQDRVFDAGDVSTVLPALQEVMSLGGTGEVAAKMGLGHFAAGKSGTTDDQKSAQFVGFIPQLATAVSMYQSDDNGNSVSLTNIGGLNQFHGGDWPATVWAQYMTAASKDMPQTDYPWITQSTRAPAFDPEPVNTPSPTPTPQPTQQPSVAPTQPEPIETQQSTQQPVAPQEPAQPDHNDSEGNQNNQQDGTVTGNNQDRKGEENPNSTDQ